MAKTILIIIFIFTNLVFPQNDFKINSRFDKQKQSKNSTSTVFKESIYRWLDSNWVVFWQNFYNYDENNNVSKIISQYKQDSIWINERTETFTYNSDNVLIEDLTQLWNGEEFGNSLRLINTVDSSNNVIQTLDQRWDKLKSEWHDLKRFHFNYDSLGNIIEEVEELIGGNASLGFFWRLMFRYTFTYDSSNTLSEESYHGWRDSIWVNLSKDYLVYDDNNNLIENLTQHWNGSSWEDEWIKLYSYDENNNQTEILEQILLSDDWENYVLFTNTFDSQNRMIESVRQKWEESKWNNTTKSIFSYEPITSVFSISTIKKQFQLFQNYPNPFNPMTKIQFSIKQEGRVNLSVYNILGEKVITLVDKIQSSGNYEVTFNPSSGVTSGIYYYRLIIGDYSETRKMIILR